MSVRMPLPPIRALKGRRSKAPGGANALPGEQHQQPTPRPFRARMDRQRHDPGQRRAAALGFRMAPFQGAIRPASISGPARLALSLFTTVDGAP